MFTGIIREIGTVGRVQRSGGILFLEIHAPKTAAHVEPLESVAVNGVCLTAVRVERSIVGVEVIGESQRCTTLGRLRAGDRVHVEPSLRLSDRLSGHVVLGHVDGTGTIVKRAQRAGALVLTIRADAAARRLLVPKGPIAVDGVSLTVGPQVRGGMFTIHLIPETLRHTMLATRRQGDRVNVEADYLAKVVALTAAGRH